MSAVSSQTQFPITTLRVAVTGETNLQCFYDKPLGRHRDTNGEPDKLTAADYCKICKAAGEAGIEHILISSGCEPLLRKDIAGVVKACCAPKKIQDVRFITNGVFLKDYADSLRRSGLKHIEIVLDSLNFLVYQKITRKDSLYRVLDGLQKAQRLNFDRLVVNVTLLRGINDRELIDFAMMTKDKPLHIQFLEYKPLNLEPTMTHQLHMSAVEAKRNIQEFQKLIAIRENGREVYKFRDGLGTVAFVANGSGHFGYDAAKLFLNSQGALAIEAPGFRSYNLCKELEKDNCEEKLQRLFQKLMQPTSRSKRPATVTSKSRSSRVRTKSSKGSKRTQTATSRRSSSRRQSSRQARA